jgi:hypothetical protein
MLPYQVELHSIALFSYSGRGRSVLCSSSTSFWPRPQQSHAQSVALFNPGVLLTPKRSRVIQVGITAPLPWVRPSIIGGHWWETRRPLLYFRRHASSSGNVQPSNDLQVLLLLLYEITLARALALSLNRNSIG